MLTLWRTQDRLYRSLVSWQLGAIGLLALAVLVNMMLMIRISALENARKEDAAQYQDRLAWAEHVRDLAVRELGALSLRHANEITDFLRIELGDAYGIYVIDASIIDVHPDAQLQQTIDDRVKAMQRKQQAEAEQETIKVQNETKILEAEADAKAKQIEADAEARANRTISESLTDELLRKMEMEARMAHGWVTVQGADMVVTSQ